MTTDRWACAAATTKPDASNTNAPAATASWPGKPFQLRRLCPNTQAATPRTSAVAATPRTTNEYGLVSTTSSRSVFIARSGRPGTPCSRPNRALRDLPEPAQPAATAMLRDPCLLYTSDAADERSSVDLGGR